MKAMDSFVRLGANHSHSLCYGADLQRRMADEDAVSCFEICGAEYWGAIVDPNKTRAGEDGMQDPFASTQAEVPTGSGDAASATHNATTSTTPSAATAPRRSTIAFTGSGSEYFRIWIVNLLLMLVTLSLYYPFAKARRLRYFHGNTLIDGQALGFHGDPWTMLRGHLLVVVFFVCYGAAQHFSPMAAAFAALLFGALWPALWQASLRFRMANTSWRGLRFRFTGDVAGAYRAFWPLLLPVVAFVAISSGSDPAEGGSALQSMLLGVSALAVFALSPYGLARIKRFQHGHYALAGETTRLDVKTGAFYSLAWRAGLLSLLPLFLVGLGAGIVTGVLMAGPKGMSGVAPALILMVVLIGLAYLLVFLLVQTYYTSRLQNLVWTHTSSQHVLLHSRLGCRALAWLTTKNFFLMVLTLGLYRPFAAVNTARMRLQAVDVVFTGDAAQWTRSAAQGAGDAAGDAAGDVLGVDIGL